MQSMWHTLFLGLALGRLYKIQFEILGLADFVGITVSLAPPRFETAPANPILFNVAFDLLLLLSEICY